MNKALKDHFNHYSSFYLIILIISFVFILIEIRYPYYFFQDDTRGYTLPMFVHNYRSLINGEIALYNFHQYLGTPSLACMQPATLYPPAYISVFLSTVLVGHPFITAEILVYFHLILAGIGFYKFFKVLGFHDYIALLSGITWPLSSFVIFVSNSWIHLSAVAAFFPWILYFSIHLYKTPRVKFLAGVVITRILLFFSGHTEYFMYSFIFEALTISLFILLEFFYKTKVKKVARPGRYIIRRLLFILTGYILTLAFSLPLLLPALKQLSISAGRAARIEFIDFVYDTIRIPDWFNGLINPIHKTTLLENNWLHTYNLTFIGYIPLIFFFITIFEILRRRIKREKFTLMEIRIYVLFFTGAIAFLWTTNMGFFAQFLYTIPYLNRTLGHLKVNIFVIFYLLTISGYGIQQVLDRGSNKLAAGLNLSRFFSVCIFLQVLTFCFLYLYLPPQCFGYHLDSLPYDEPLKAEIKDGRYIAAGFPMYDANPLGAATTCTYSFPPIAYNYASLWDLYTFGGYEALIGRENDAIASDINHHGTYLDSPALPVPLLKEWGVKWYIIKNGEILTNPAAFQIFKDENRSLYFDPEAKPLFYFSDPVNSDVSINYKINTNYIDLVFESRKEDKLTINFLYNDYFKAYIDGKKTGLLKNNNSQMAVIVSMGKHTVRVKYEDPEFHLGMSIALSTAVVCAVIMLLRFFYCRKKNMKNKIVMLI